MREMTTCSEIPQDSPNILLHTTEDETRNTMACARLFDTASATAVHGLVVTVARTADDWLTQQEGPLPDELVVLSVGEPIRSTAAASGSTQPPAPAPGPIIDSVPQPTDLAAIGMKINMYLQQLHDTDPTNPAPTLVVCIDSISDLLEASDVHSVFRFLHLLTSLVNTLDATAHYHLNPAAHDTETLATLAALFNTETTA